jgi:hypothetical protein
MRSGSNPTVQIDEDSDRQVLFDDRATGELGTLDHSGGRDRIMLDADLVVADRSSPSTGTGTPCVDTPTSIDRSVPRTRNRRSTSRRAPRSAPPRPATTARTSSAPPARGTAPTQLPLHAEQAGDRP